MSPRDQVTPDLCTWDSIKDRFVGESLLVGNGASCAVWEAFRYESLFKKAITGDNADNLTGTNQELFTAFDTINFEQVLSALATTQVVCDALSVPSEFAAEHYLSIQRALVSAVKAVHVEPSSIEQTVQSRIGDALSEYKWVYSTNYDLLLYWGVMTQNKSERAVDYFGFGQETDRFDPSRTEPFDHERCRILYLHGGLHLVRLQGGGTRKVRHDSFGALLEKFGQGLGVGESPLVVTEGDARNKLASIATSDYLNFTFRTFQGDSRPLVVFGHSLSANDKHIVDAMKAFGTRNIAISVVARDPSRIRKTKLAYLNALDPIVPEFFNAATHPLGSPSLRIPEDEGKVS